MSEKNDYLDLSFRSILLAYHECYVFGRIYESLKIPQPAPCAANFRDTFFHFKKLYEADFDDDALAQYESIIEHINRLFKDSIVTLTQVIIFSLNELMKKTNDKKIYMQLYDFKVELKLIQLRLRAKALEIIRPLDDIEESNAIIKQFNNIISYLKSNNLLDEVITYNSEYR